MSDVEPSDNIIPPSPRSKGKPCSLPSKRPRYRQPAPVKPGSLCFIQLSVCLSLCFIILFVCLSVCFILFYTVICLSVTVFYTVVCLSVTVFYTAACFSCVCWYICCVLVQVSFGLEGCRKALSRHRLSDDARKRVDNIGRYCSPLVVGRFLSSSIVQEAWCELESCSPDLSRRTCGAFTVVRNALMVCTGLTNARHTGPCAT